MVKSKRLQTFRGGTSGISCGSEFFITPALLPYSPLPGSIPWLLLVIRELLLVNTFALLVNRETLLPITLSLLPITLQLLPITLLLLPILLSLLPITLSLLPITEKSLNSTPIFHFSLFTFHCPLIFIILLHLQKGRYHKMIEKPVRYVPVPEEL